MGFVISLFDAEVGIYEVHDEGARYVFGFGPGLGFIIGAAHLEFGVLDDESDPRPE